VLSGSLSQINLAAQHVDQTLHRALVAAAINCSRVGCQPPDVVTLEAAL